MIRAYSVVNDYSKEAIEKLLEYNVVVEIANTKERPQKKELKELLQNYDILIIGAKEKITKDMLEVVHTPKIIASLSIGLDHIDSQFSKSDLITVVNCPESNVNAVAEHTFSLLLALEKRIIEANKIVQEEKTKKILPQRTEEIQGKTLGIIGAGKIASRMITIAKAFQMPILCYTKHSKKHTELKKEVEFVDLNTLLKKSDIISVHIPLTEETYQLISDKEISLIKENATFLNTARAEIVNIPALIEKADRNANFKVGLDIETKDYEDLFSTFRKNVIVTPHIAGLSKQAIEKMDKELAQNIIQVLTK